MSLAPTVAQELGEGRYRLIDVVGSGGMATVYRAWDDRLRTYCAIKILKPQQSRRTSVRARLQKEAWTMARLRHPHIVAVHDVGEHDGQLFLVMEYVPGGSLYERLRQGPLPARTAVAVMTDVLGAVQAVHEAGIIHRDIKPHNLLLTDSGIPKVTDFGIARDINVASQLTATGTVMGTWAYMAPELRFAADQASPRSDIYAAGATLYAMLTARDPFEFYAVDLDSAVKSVFVSVIPEPLQALILRATRYAPDDRFGSASEMARELDAVLDDLAPLPAGFEPLATAPAPPLPPAPTPPPSNSTQEVVGTADPTFFDERSTEENSHTPHSLWTTEERPPRRDPLKSNDLASVTETMTSETLKGPAGPSGPIDESAPPARHRTSSWIGFAATTALVTLITGMTTFTLVDWLRGPTVLPPEPMPIVTGTMGQVVVEERAADPPPEPRGTDGDEAPQVTPASPTGPATVPPRVEDDHAAVTGEEPVVADAADTGPTEAPATAEPEPEPSGAGEIHAAAPRRVGGWMVDTFTDPAGAVVSAAATTEAVNLTEGWPDLQKRSKLVVRCDHGRAGAYVVTGMTPDSKGTGARDELFADATLTLDGGPTQDLRLRRDDGIKALHFRKPRNVAKQLAVSGSASFGFTPFASPVATARFDLSGAEEALAPVREACGI